MHLSVILKCRPYVNMDVIANDNRPGALTSVTPSAYGEQSRYNVPAADGISARSPLPQPSRAADEAVLLAPTQQVLITRSCK